MTLPHSSYDAVLKGLIKAVGASFVVVNPPDMAPYLRDWHGDETGSALAVVRPASTAEVQQVLALCYEAGVAVIPQGGNTGLVLGALSSDPAPKIVLALERLKRIRHLDVINSSVVVEAGCVLAHLQNEVAAKGLLFPVSLGAEGSCQIGGTISTNAGGINVLRYGMMREQVLGLEVVMADGRLWSNLNALRKDNRGIDVNQLFVGAEGTLGIVTAACLRLWPKPSRIATALLAVESVAHAVQIYQLARQQCGDIMTAFELMPQLAMELAQEALPDLVFPFQYAQKNYVLLEFSGAELLDIDSLLAVFMERIFEQGLIVDAVVAQSQAQAESLWAFREGMNEGQARRGLHLRSDVSVSISDLAEFVDRVEQALTAQFPDAEVLSYGHIGDGNVHVNVLPATNATVEQRTALITVGTQLINDMVATYSGSISAEHGIGRLKREAFMQQMKPLHHEILLGIKRNFDPKNILNPGCLVHTLDRSRSQEAH